MAAPPQRFPNLKEALAAVASRFDVRIGLEFTSAETEMTPIVLSFTGGVSRALNEIVVQHPEFEWKKEDGVYSFCPRAALNSLCGLKIRTFVLKDATLEQASRAITDIPEFRDFLSERGLTRRELQTGGASRSQNKVTLALRNVPMRRILNQLAKRFGLKHWTVLRYGENLKYVAIYFHNDQ